MFINIHYFKTFPHGIKIVLKHLKVLTIATWLTLAANVSISCYSPIDQHQTNFTQRRVSRGEDRCSDSVNEGSMLSS